MKLGNRRRFAIGMAVLTLAGLLAGLSVARARLSVEIAPSVIEKLARPGVKLKDFLFYTNHSDTPLLVSVSMSDFLVGNEAQAIERPTGTESSSLAKYVRITPLQARVLPGQQARFRYTIEAPQQFSHLRAMLWFESRAERAEADAGRVAFVSRMGIPLYLENQRARPASLEIQKVQWQRSASDTLQLDLWTSNQGERLMRPEGLLSVRSRDGKFSKTFPLNAGRSPVVPGQERKWSMSFGPVPVSELQLEMDFATSTRSRFMTQDRIPAAVR